jgi:hypothetical protein
MSLQLQKHAQRVDELHAHLNSIQKEREEAAVHLNSISSVPPPQKKSQHVAQHVALMQATPPDTHVLTSAHLEQPVKLGDQSVPTPRMPLDRDSPGSKGTRQRPKLQGAPKTNKDKEMSTAHSSSSGVYALPQPIVFQDSIQFDEARSPGSNPKEGSLEWLLAHFSRSILIGALPPVVSLVCQHAKPI